MLYKWKILKTTMLIKRLLNYRPKYDLIQIAETRLGGGGGGSGCFKLSGVNLRMQDIKVILL